MRLISPLPPIPNIKNPMIGSNFALLQRDILALLFTQMLTRFEEGTDADGIKWEKLKRDQFRRRDKKIRNPSKKGQIKILQDDGTLRQSWTQEGAEGNEVIQTSSEVGIGSNVEYVRTHNEGLTLQHPGTDNGFGMGIEIAPYKIQMPKRQMTGYSLRDEKEIQELIDSHLQDAGGFE